MTKACPIFNRFELVELFLNSGFHTGFIDTHTNMLLKIKFSLKLVIFFTLFVFKPYSRAFDLYIKEIQRLGQDPMPPYFLEAIYRAAHKAWWNISRRLVTKFTVLIRKIRNYFSINQATLQSNFTNMIDGTITTRSSPVILPFFKEFRISVKSPDYCLIMTVFVPCN